VQGVCGFVDIWKCDCAAVSSASISQVGLAMWKQTWGLLLKRPSSFTNFSFCNLVYHNKRLLPVGEVRAS
jgi:hypothetical protein